MCYAESFSLLIIVVSSIITGWRARLCNIKLLVKSEPVNEFDMMLI